MRADFLSYRRATMVSLLGLVIQIAAGATLVVFGAIGRDHAAMTAGLAGIAGLVVWLCLSIVYDQHRRERVEAMEAEALAAGPVSGSVFDAGAQDFRVAARRLAGMYRVFLPVVSVLFGGGLIGLGLWRLASARAVVNAERFPEAKAAGWALGLTLAVAVVGFVFARFVAGMAKAKVWGNLRGGAAQSVGLALMALAIAVGHFVDLVGPSAVRQSVTVILPIALIVVGGEALLNFLLDFYRPRKAGETPRPALDSRLLGFVAAPDQVARSVGEALAYQFGLDLRESWFARLLARARGPLLLTAVGVMWGLTSLTVIQPHQRGLVTRFGTLVREVGPGIHLKWPWPIDRVEIPAYVRTDERGAVVSAVKTATGIRLLELGTAPPTGTGAILWTNEHARQEIYQIVQPASVRFGRGAVEGGPESAAADGLRDVALLAIEVPMHYVVRSVELFERLAPPAQREGLLTAVAQREVMRAFAHERVDDVLGPRREALSAALAERIQSAFDRLNPGVRASDGSTGAGVKVVFVGVNGVHPAKEVATNYENVVQAEQNRRAAIAAAEGDAIRAVTSIVGSVQAAEDVSRRLDELDALKAAGAEPGVIDARELDVQRVVESSGGAGAAAIAGARAERWSRHMGERARAMRYRGQLASYRASPVLYKTSVFLDALREAMADARVYITGPDANKVRVRMQLEDRMTGVEVFQGDKPRSGGSN